MSGRGFRGANHGRRDAGDFDPVTEGGRRGLSPEVSRELWARVRLQDGDGTRDDAQAERRFRRYAAHVAAAGGQIEPGPDASTRLDGATGINRAEAVSIIVGPDTLAGDAARAWRLARAATT